MTDDLRSAIRSQRVVGIVRSASGDAAIETGRRLLAHGLRAIEVALTTPGGLGAIEVLAAEAPEGAAVGAGTVLDEPTAAAAIRCGARFLVSPTMVPAVIGAAKRYGVLSVPAAATPTEMMTALELGADFVKVFPAAAWTPRALGALLEALPQLPLVPTGGVTLDDAPDWIAAGAVAVGLGGALGRASAEEVVALLDRLS